MRPEYDFWTAYYFRNVKHAWNIFLQKILEIVSTQKI